MKDEKEKDDFWDLSRLLPAKKKKTTAFRAPTALPSVATVEFGNDAPLRREEKIPTPHSETGNAVQATCYTPADNPLILAVEVKNKSSSYSFYGQFRAHGARLLSMHGTPDTPYVSYFSYIPQYAQLNDAQRAYYLYFRDAVSRREKVRTDFSYLLLLIYEILNLPDLIPPRDGIETLVYLFITYREDFPKIDKYLATWIPDYCLLHRLPAPTAALRPILPYVLAAADFKEFYLGNVTTLSDEGLSSFLALASDYHWRYSRYAVGEAEEIFRTAMRGALFPLLREILTEESIGRTAEERVRAGDAFSGSLTAHNIRCALRVVYRPFDHTPRLRRILTQAVKYTENKIRARLGIRSRLSVDALHIDYKTRIDAYFASLPTYEKKKTEAPRPNYEYLYDAESETLSLSEAAAIESASWDTTRILVGDDGVFTEEEAPRDNKYNPEATVPNAVGKAAVDKDRYGLSDAAFAFLAACASGDCAALSRVAPHAPDRDALAEAVNAAFAENFGDIILLPDDNGQYSLIEDYESEIREWIETMK